MSNVECDSFDNVASNAAHINQQGCVVEDKASELFVALPLAKTSSIASMICLKILEFSLEVMIMKDLLQSACLLTTIADLSAP